MNLSRPEPRLVQFSFALAAVAALLALVFSTRWGPGVGGDATIYIVSARNFASGQGLGLIQPDGSFRLLPYFAPFFSLVLSLFALLGADLVQTARWLNMLMFSGLVWLAGASTHRLTRSWLAGLAAALILAGSPILIPIFSWAMSEPMALFLGFAGLWLALLALRSEKPGPAFYGSAALTGLSFLTRYSSAAFVGAAALGLLVFGQARWPRRIWLSLLYGLLAAVPTAVWLLVDYLLTATLSSRSVESGQGMAQRFSAFWPQLGQVFLTWLVPFSWIDAPRYPAAINRLLPVLLPLVLIGWAALVAGLALRRRAPITWADERLRWAALLAFLLLAYLAVILFVYVTTYPPITIDNRMLSPLHIGALWLVVMLAALTPGLLRWPRWLNTALMLAVALLVAWFGWRSLRIVQVNYDLGLGYTSLEWRNSQTIQAVKALPPDAPIVTNETTALLFLTGRRAYPLAEIYLDHPLSVYTRFGEGDLSKDAGQRLFSQGDIPLVLFDSIYSQMEGVYGQQAPQRLSALTAGLRQTFKGDDGAIYYYNNGLKNVP